MVVTKTKQHWMIFNANSAQPTHSLWTMPKMKIITIRLAIAFHVQPEHLVEEVLDIVNTARPASFALNLVVKNAVLVTIQTKLINIIAKDVDKGKQQRAKVKAFVPNAKRGGTSPLILNAKIVPPANSATEAVSPSVPIVPRPKLRRQVPHFAPNAMQVNTCQTTKHVHCVA